MTPRLYLVSGVCGAGKSSTLTPLRSLLPAERYEVRDFDERGVPDGGGQVWHDAETRHWLDVARQNAAAGKSTVVCGFADPKRFRKVRAVEDVPATLILLDASADTLRSRLAGRHASTESIEEIERASGQRVHDFIEANVAYAPELRAICEREGLPIIDTDGKDPAQVAGAIADIIASESRQDASPESRGRS